MEDPNSTPPWGRQGTGTATTPVTAPGQTAQPQELPVTRAARPNARDFHDRDLSGADLEGADLSGADLSGAHLFRARLKGANLSRANLAGAELSGADLTDAQLDEVHAPRAGFGMACLRGARLFGADLSGATFSGSDLSGADVRCSTLHGARFRETDLTGCDFTSADLAGADLAHADVRNASFRNADLREARLRSLQHFKKADWIGVDIRSINFAGAYRLRRFVIDQNYLKEFRQGGPWSRALYYLWWVTSDCGRSVGRWGAWIMVQTFFFAWLYTLVGIDFGASPTFLSPLYFSVVTFTTLGYGDVTPIDLPGQMVVMTEVLFGYVMLGGLLSIFSNIIARRGE